MCHQAIKRILIFAALFCSTAIYANDVVKFFEVKVLPGDGIYSLLRRYDLDRSACNITKFYELNNLTEKSQLYVGKSYKLPIYIYSYNGTSIRSTIGDQDYDKAVRIQAFNEAMHQRSLVDGDYRDTKVLLVPHNELDCKDVIQSSGETASITSEEKSKPKAAASSTVVHSELFGPKYADVNIIDEQLKGHVYYIVSGHGGPDPGAMCTDCAETYCEDEYAYDVALRLARDLMQHSATVHVIVQDENDGIRDGSYLPCDKDEVCIGGYEMPVNNKKRLYQRSGAINKLYERNKAKGVKVQKAIVIHVDSRSKDKRQDVFFYYKKDDKASKDMAEDMQNTFKKKYDKFQKGRGYKGTVQSRNLHMLRAVRPTTVFIELANIRNKNDHERLLRDYNRQALANWLFEGATGIE